MYLIVWLSNTVAKCNVNASLRVTSSILRTCPRISFHLSVFFFLYDILIFLPLSSIQASIQNAKINSQNCSFSSAYDILNISFFLSLVCNPQSNKYGFVDMLPWEHIFILKKSAFSFRKKHSSFFFPLNSLDTCAIS